MRRVKSMMQLTATAVAWALLWSSVSLAGKPGNPGGGGADESTDRFTVIDLSIDGDPVTLTEASSDDLMTVAIDAHEAGYISAAFALVDATAGDVIAAGFLPEPPYVDPNDGVMKNGWSEPADANLFGEIVGTAATWDPDAVGDPSPGRAILWIPNGTGYDYLLLPLPTGATASRAFGTNAAGDIVGLISTSVGPVAAWWDSETLSPNDLNTESTSDLGWELLAAYDIADGGLVVGLGRLDGVYRGFVLDLVSGGIIPVPLVGAGTENIATRVNAMGRVIGDAWNGSGSPWGAEPDYYHAFSWDGPGSDAVELSSLTFNTSIAAGLNDFGATVGSSIIPTDDLLADRWVPTLWEINAEGFGTATDLQSEISNKSSWELIRSHDVNNEGWISVYGRRRSKGNYNWRALLLKPTL